jgi:DNA-binding NarL/FixJ family response regulator
MASEIRVAIADDHQGIIDGYFYRLSSESDIKVVGAAFDAQQLEALLAKHPETDVLILDAELPTAPDNPNIYPILHLIPDFLQRYRPLAILVISMHDEHALINEIIKAGALGYILKDDREAVQNVATAIRMVAKGEVFFSEQAQQVWQKRRLATKKPTPRQLQVLSLCAAEPYLKTSELAERLSVAPATARNLLSGAYQRLGVRNRASAIAKARQLGLITSKSEYPAT